MIALSQASASIHVPDGAEVGDALGRVTHLGIGAHQDDLEFMAFHGIAACYESSEKWFGGVTCTDGAGSARPTKYAGLDEAAFVQLRRDEQDRAADIGKYAAMLQLGFSSAAAKQGDDALIGDLWTILSAVRPGILYTHNPADKHPTHIAIFCAVLAAVRSLPPEIRPTRMLGCEVWRGLDWLPDSKKVRLNVSSGRDLASRLHAVFESQTGAKRYDLAVQGRWQANATFDRFESPDSSDLTVFAMDLTPLIREPFVDARDFVSGLVDELRQDITRVL